MIQETKTWQQLSVEMTRLQSTSLKQLFANKQRISQYSTSIDGIYVDYSKNLLDESVMQQLHQLADEQNVRQKVQAMFNGDPINTTEKRAVLHTALRDQSGTPTLVNGKNVQPDITKEFKKMRGIAKVIGDGQWFGSTEKAITHVVHIGIGGSYLGPKMAIEALQHYRTNDIEVAFVSNIDGDQFAAVTKNLNPETTLFIVASKTFTTLETMTNAHTAREWITKNISTEAVAKHFIALSTNTKAVTEFGIHPNNILRFWDWVGGRYSLLSAIGLPLMIAIGPDNFDAIRKGAYSIDQHIQKSPAEENIPLTLALIGIWNRNFLGHQTEVLVPYASALAYFVEYMQQANMESNGKIVTKNGSRVSYHTGPIIWGGPGTDTQHSFFQHIHQGTAIAPVDFIGFIEPHTAIGDHHKKLLANMFAQSDALAFGRTLKEVTDSGVDAVLAPHKAFDGNRPSTTILIDKLSPYSLGQLLAIYEHKILYQGLIWNINSFDQMGVELGKQLAKDTFTSLNGKKGQNISSSTQALITRVQNYKKSG